MNWQQAFDLMKQGEKVRRKSWKNLFSYLYIDTDGMIKSQNNTPAYFFAEHFEANDWQLVNVYNKHTQQISEISLLGTRLVIISSKEPGHAQRLTFTPSETESIRRALNER